MSTGWRASLAPPKAHWGINTLVIRRQWFCRELIDQKTKERKRVTWPRAWISWMPSRASVAFPKWHRRNCQPAKHLAKIAYLSNWCAGWKNINTQWNTTWSKPNRNNKGSIWTTINTFFPVFPQLRQTTVSSHCFLCEKKDVLGESNCVVTRLIFPHLRQTTVSAHCFLWVYM